MSNSHLSYFDQFRSLPHYRWWRPVVALGVAVAALVALAFTYQALLQLWVNTLPLQADGSVSVDDPFLLGILTVLLSSGIIILFIPAVLIATKVTGLGGIRSTVSVVGRFRWRWARACAVPGLAFAVVITFIIPLGLGAIRGQTPDLSIGANVTPSLFLLLLIVVVTTALQSTAEEFAFRSLIGRALAAITRTPIVAAVLTTALFAASHGQYDAWGVSVTAVFGLAMFILVWKTGGLEAAVVLHIANNVGVDILSTLEVDGLGAQEEGLVLFLSIAIPIALYTVTVLRMARHRGVQRFLPTEATDDAGTEAIESSEAGSSVECELTVRR